MRSPRSSDRGLSPFPGAVGCPWSSSRGPGVPQRPGARRTPQERLGRARPREERPVHRSSTRWSGPLRPRTVPHGRRHGCSRRSAWGNQVSTEAVTGLAMSTRPQLGTQLGTDSHGCSYGSGDDVTSVPSRASVQVSGVRGHSVPPHSVDNPGGGAASRPVDEASVCAHVWVSGPVPRSAPSTGPGRCRGPVQAGAANRSAPLPRGPGDDGGPRPPEGTRASATVRAREFAQRQRIDMISPATMAPKPMAKFHAESDTMNGMRSPAT